MVHFCFRQLRDLKKLSQKEVSTHSSIPQSQYSRIQNGPLSLPWKTG
ncbi:helix-turn-helix domain-containing protein [Leadbetterella sp. DM7]